MTITRQTRLAFLILGSLAILAGITRLWVLSSVSSIEMPTRAQPESSMASAPNHCTAQPASRPAVLQLPGSIEAFEVTDMFAKVSGYITEVRVDIGDRIRSGQVLALIYVPELENELAQAQAEEASRAAALQVAEKTELAARTKLEVARRQLLPFEAEARLKEVTFQRLLTLVKTKAASDQDLDDIRATRDASAAEVEVAIRKIEATEADLAVAKSAISLAARQLEVAKAQAVRIETLIGYTRIVAPYDGVVTRRLINRGVLVQAATSMPGLPLYTVQRTDLVRVFADVPETDAGRVGPGTPAEVTPYGLGGEVFHGTVTRTASSLDPTTRTLRVEVDFPNPAGRLLNGMYVQVRFQTDLGPTATQSGGTQP